MNKCVDGWSMNHEWTNFAWFPLISCEMVSLWCMHLKLGFDVVTFIRDWSPMPKDFVLWGSFIKKTTLQTYQAS